MSKLSESERKEQNKLDSLFLGDMKSVSVSVRSPQVAMAAAVLSKELRKLFRYVPSMEARDLVKECLHNYIVDLDEDGLAE